jgi:hypothetical protein
MPPGSIAARTSWRNALAYTGKSGPVVSAFIATAFAQDDAQAARTQWQKFADQLRPKLPKLAPDGYRTSTRKGVAYDCRYRVLAPQNAKGT